MVFSKEIKITLIIFLVVLVGAGIIFLFPSYNGQNEVKIMNQEEIKLPQTKKISQTSIEEALSERRSVRRYKDEPLSLEDASQLLWAAQGITLSETGLRTTPSAGALYPLELYLVVRKSEEIKPGVYRYLPEKHKIVKILEKDIGDDLTQAALGQRFVAEAPVNLIFSAVFERTTTRYGERGIQYVYMEAGHASQNVYLQAQSLGLGTVVVGAFQENRVREILGIPKEEVPLYIMPIGKP